MGQTTTFFMQGQSNKDLPGQKKEGGANGAVSTCPHCSGALPVGRQGSHKRKSNRGWNKLKIVGKSVVETFKGFFVEDGGNLVMAIITFFIIMIFLVAFMTYAIVFHIVPFAGWLCYELLWVYSFVYDSGCFNKSVPTRLEQTTCDGLAAVSFIGTALGSVLVFWGVTVIRITVKNYKRAMKKLCD